jgi:hypothetical protein
VNNAVSRTAGVLAIAIMGAIAIIAFRGALIRQTADLNLSAGATEALLAEASKLGDAGVPASVPAAQAEAADQAIKRAFVDVFRLLSLIGAALAFASALAAGLVIEKRMEQIE